MNCIDPIHVIESFLTEGSCSEVLNESMRPYEVTWVEYVKVLAKTLVLEFPVYFAFVRGMISFRSILLLTIILNLATHPMVIFGIPLIANYLHLSFGSFILMSEAFAPLVEALMMKVIWKLSWRRSLGAAIFANLLSWWLGSYWVS